MVFCPREIPGTFKMNLQSAYVDGLNLQQWMMEVMMKYLERYL
ncbi:MAG: hypothetical protein Ct9H90mP6_08520 [Gammaproteobacteria bacterium]|nr:MAG: hypothetical protein Ct9H90mP6_08520 [Gammaproteobacteria bacterium]